MRLLGKAVLTISALGLAASTSAQDVRNEGAGSRREALDLMIFQPAPTDDLLAASDWIGDKPTSASLNGKPVLVFTFAEWYRPSHTAAMLGKRLKDQHPDLVIIGIHDSEGWDEAKAFAEKRKLGFSVALDTDGAIRDSFMVDQDPDVFVIDRAGNLRFADITTDSVAAAVEVVASESSEEARNAEANQAEAMRSARAAQRRAGGINQSVSLDNLPKIPFTAPTAEQYAATDWPKIDRELLEEASSIEELTPPFAVPDGEWLNGKPDTDGKIVVAYIWHPISRTVMNDLMVKMEDMHKQQSRDVTVMGFMVPIGDDRQSRNRDGGLIRDEFRDLSISKSGMSFALGQRQITHSLLASQQGSPLPALGNQRSRRNNQDLNGRVIIVSSDGRVRRAVDDMRDWDLVLQAVDHLIRVDPGVKARRAAEARYIRGNGG
ncbi:MAG: TlpA family protein disulfide reductase [Phycisphaera sp.]|nr:MAG: TlpA family protein disulfide reductase [Phycisphaera sp.]